MAHSMVLLLACLAVCHATTSEVVNGENGISSLMMPAEDGNLHIYALPVGQGDAQVIQCPNGDLTIYDWGSSNDVSDRFWAGPEVLHFLTGRLGRVRNIVLTHNHGDHYSLLGETFTNNNLNNLRNIYISCLQDHFPWRVNNWIDANPGFRNLLRTFNNGNPCGGRPGFPMTCGTLDICPGTSITATVLGANLGQQCSEGNRNMDCIITRITWGAGSILMGADLNDETFMSSEVGPMRWLMNNWGSDISSTVYQVAHHSSSRLANKAFWRSAVNPRAVYTTGDPNFIHGHPRCVVIEGFSNLCHPLQRDCASCTIHPNLPDDRILQNTFTCCLGEDDCRPGHGGDNREAVYTTTPDGNTINLVTYSTNGNFGNSHCWSVTAMKLSSPSVAQFKYSGVEFYDGEGPHELPDN